MSRHPYETRLIESWPPSEWRDRTILVAVSGGADSVALLRGLATVREQVTSRLVVAHFNHRLRGEASNADEQFVSKLGEELGLSIEIGRADIAEGLESLSNAMTHRSEESSRRSRYEFLTTAAGHVGARYVVTAHTADDQAETILHRFLRGTGLSGLAGMRRARPLDAGIALIRPLLTFRRNELRTYLDDLQQPFREDASNADRSFTRNRLRKELIPQLERDYNPAVVEAILRLGNLAGEAQHVFVGETSRLSAAIQRKGDHELVLDCRLLLNEPPFLIRELLILLWREQGWPEQAMGLREWTELADMVAPNNSSSEFTNTTRMFPGSVRAQKTGEQLSLTRRLD